MKKRLLSLLLAFLFVLALLPVSVQADGAVFPFTPRQLAALMNSALGSYSMRVEIIESAQGVFLSVDQQGVTKALIQFGRETPQHDPDRPVSQVTMAMQNIHRENDIYRDAVPMMDAIVAACEPGLTDVERSSPILAVLDTLESGGPLMRCDRDRFIYSLSRDWVFTVDPSRQSPRLSGSPELVWPDSASYNGYTISHWNDGTGDYFRVHDPNEPIGVPTFYLRPEDVYVADGPAKNVIFRFFRQYDAASAAQADAFCAYLRDQAYLEGYAAWYTFPDTGCYVVFSDGWDLDAYSRDPRLLFDWGPWTNCDNHRLSFRLVDYGNRIESGWGSIWNELQGSTALWLMPQESWGGLTIALCFTDGEDGSVLRRYCDNETW